MAIVTATDFHCNWETTLGASPTLERFIAARVPRDGTRETQEALPPEHAARHRSPESMKSAKKRETMVITARTRGYRCHL